MTLISAAAGLGGQGRLRVSRPPFHHVTRLAEHSFEGRGLAFRTHYFDLFIGGPEYLFKETPALEAPEFKYGHFVSPGERMAATIPKPKAISSYGFKR
jgi:hypothetical protein